MQLYLRGKHPLRVALNAIVCGLSAAGDTGIKQLPSTFIESILLGGVGNWEYLYTRTEYNEVTRKRLEICVSLFATFHRAVKSSHKFRISSALAFESLELILEGDSKWPSLVKPIDLYWSAKSIERARRSSLAKILP